MKTLAYSLSMNPGLKIGCLNIRGLLNKISEIKSLILACNFDILGICETFIDATIGEDEIKIDGY